MKNLKKEDDIAKTRSRRISRQVLKYVTIHHNYLLTQTTEKQKYYSNKQQSLQEQ